MTTKPTIQSAGARPTVTLPRYAVILAPDATLKVGDEMYAVMDGPDADMYHEGPGGTPLFVGRVLSAEDTWGVKMLCTGGYKPRFKVVRVSQITATVDVEQIV